MDPLDFYVFGYCLVHLPIQCQSVSIHVFTSLEMLVHGLSEQKNGRILGNIEDLNFFFQDCVDRTSLSNYLSNFHIRYLSLYEISSPLVPILVEWILKMSPRLKSIGLHFSECEDDYLLFQSIQHTNLEEFCLEYYSTPPTQKGVQELCKIITTSSTLTGLVLNCPYLAHGDQQKRSELSYKLYPVLQAALSSSTISILETNFGYRVYTNTRKRFEFEEVTLDLTSIVSDFQIHPLELLRSFQYLSCIAEKNFIKSMRVQIDNIDDILFAMPHFCCDFIMSLDCSLDNYMEELHFSTKGNGLYLRTNPSLRDCMARDLRRASQHNLRRSQSLCDLRTLHFPHRHRHEQYIIPFLYLGEPPLHQSCPNLLEMQALQNMHPVLQEALGYDQL